MEIWMVCVEVIVPSETVDPIPPTERCGPASEIGFMNFTTWADSQQMAEAKVQKCLESYGWHLISIENARVVSEDHQCGEVELDQIERTRGNPNAVIFGTFHTYKTN
jgi:hypothetical protein